MEEAGKRNHPCERKMPGRGEKKAPIGRRRKGQNARKEENRTLAPKGSASEKMSPSTNTSIFFAVFGEIPDPQNLVVTPG